MSDVQRATIRDVFARIGVSDAKGQFAVPGNSWDDREEDTWIDRL